MGRVAARSFLAGMLIAVGALSSMSASAYGNVVQGLCFSVGLFGVLCCRAVLFTGSVLSVQRVWDRQTGHWAFVGLLATSWPMNMLGAVCVALMASWMGYDASAVAAAKAQAPEGVLLARSFLCNVMVCMAAWVFRESAHAPVDAAVAATMPVACFVACGFEHCVADMLYMPLGVMNGSVGLADCAYVISVATVGNLLGGLAFAALTRR